MNEKSHHHGRKTNKNCKMKHARDEENPFDIVFARRFVYFDYFSQPTLFSYYILICWGRMRSLPSVILILNIHYGSIEDLRMNEDLK